MSARAVASAGSGSGRPGRGRANAGSHPHAALLVAVAATIATEPAVQAGHDAATNFEYAGAGLWIGVAMAGATFANALVHPHTLPAAWQLASLAMFGLAIGLTVWLVVRAAQPHAEAVPT